MENFQQLRCRAFEPLFVVQPINYNPDHFFVCTPRCFFIFSAFPDVKHWIDIGIFVEKTEPSGKPEGFLLYVKLGGKTNLVFVFCEHGLHIFFDEIRHLHRRTADKVFGL